MRAPRLSIFALLAAAILLILLVSAPAAEAHSNGRQLRRLHQAADAQAEVDVSASTTTEAEAPAAAAAEEAAVSEEATLNAAAAEGEPAAQAAPEEPAVAAEAEEPAVATPEPAAAAPAAPAGPPTAQTKEAQQAAVIESLGKADDKETDKKFEQKDDAPKNGVRLIKDILTGKLKPILPKVKGSSGVAEQVSAVVAAALAQNKETKKEEEAPAPVVNVEANLPASTTTATPAKGPSARPRPPYFHHHRAGHVGVGVANSWRSEFHSKEAKPMHLSIGSVMATPDIIEDGALKPVWNVSAVTAEAKENCVPPERDYSDFYLWRTLKAGDKGNRIITAQKPFVFVNNTEVVNAKLSLWGLKHMTPIPLTNGTESEEVVTDSKTKKTQKKHELLFGLQYECHTDGYSLVTVVMRVFELTRGQRSSEVLQWSFLKYCNKPTASKNETNTEGNAAIPGLSMGTRHNTSDVVEHGEAKPEWTLGSEQKGVGHRLHTYDAEVEGAKFWMRYEPPVADVNITVNKAVFIIDDPTVLFIESSGDLTEQSTVIKGSRTYTLALTFNCKKAGESNMTVVFNFPSIEAGKISYSFRKLCTGLAVSDGATMNGINVWQDENKELTEPDVVKNGVVQPEWRPVQNLTNENDVVRTAGADKDTTYVSFFFKLKKGYHPVEYDPPVVDSYSPTGEIIVRPQLHGGLFEASKLIGGQKQFLILTFHCVKEGEAVVTIKLPFRPSGAIQFNMRKTCEITTKAEDDAAKAVSEYSTGDVLTPLPGINIGHRLNSASVVKNGIPSTIYHWETSVADLVLIKKDNQWVNFFLWKDSKAQDAKDVRFGRPELISTADIARPIIAGLGSEGGLIADNEYSTISVTFHCFAQGNTTISIIIPLVGDEWLDARNQPVSIKPARSDPIKISFVKECPAAIAEPLVGMGGIGISGFSVGFAANTSELVFNGFPRSEYFGQRNKKRPDWKIVPSATDSSTLYLHYNAKGLENLALGKEVIFQSPVVVAHNPTAKPVLAGTGSNGGVLVRDGPAIPLDLTYGCRYAGLAVLTVIIPIVPHGQISITIPKYCKEDAPLTGVKISGLQVGTTKNGAEVVKDGQTNPEFISVATKKAMEHRVLAHEETATFYVRKMGDAIRALEPLVYAHNPIVNVRVTHALLVNSTDIDDDTNGDEIELNEEVGFINITFACAHRGKTDITVSLNLLPKGQVQWTFEKHCMDANPYSAFVNNPLIPELNHNFESDPMMMEDDEGNSWDSSSQRSAYNDYLNAGANANSDEPDYARASIGAGGDASHYGWDRTYNPHSSLDHTDPETRAAFVNPLNSFQIGTSREGEAAHDVFHKNLPTTRYFLKDKASLDVNQYAVIKPDQDTAHFYLSTSHPSNSINHKAPFVVLDKKFLSFLNPKLTGPAAAGGTLAPGKPLKLEVTFNCEKGGIFAVPIKVPVGSEYASFRVIKICPSYDIKEEAGFIWTAGNVFTLIGLTVAIIALVAGFIVFRRIFQQKKTLANAMYVPVQTAEHPEEGQ